MSSNAFSQMLTTKLGRYLPNSSYSVFHITGVPGLACSFYIQAPQQPTLPAPQQPNFQAPQQSSFQVTSPTAQQSLVWNVIYRSPPSGEQTVYLTDFNSISIVEDVANLETATSQIINRIKNS